ncbi:neuroglian-like isoform X3 [Lineus longissimus]|uniref:neuroglian-like isoform X3 n=1 Tax=Lineus longissimus TaxID=88925 RepID=UPI00315CC087
MGLLSGIFFSVTLALVVSDRAFAQTTSERQVNGVVMIYPVLLPPHIVMNEPEVIIKGDTTFSLKCVGTGVPSPRVEWIKLDGTLLADRNENGVLVFDGFGRKQVGKYQCKASSGYGTVASNYVYLKYAFLGNFQEIQDVTPMTVVEGAALTLPCRTAAGMVFSVPDPVWTWVTQDTLEPTNPQQKRVNLDSRVSVDKDGNLKFAYVTETDHQDGWFYLCEAWNSNLNYKKLGSPNKINVQPRPNAPKTAPEISYTNADLGTNKVKVVEGELLNLYCIFKGYPTPSITWSKAGGLPVSVQSNGNTRMLMEHVKHNNMYNGIYTCKGTNSEGTTEQNYDVEVLMKPKFVEGPNMVKNTNVTEGGDVEFICDVVAKPDATIKWRVNNIEVPDGDKSEPRRTVSGNRFKMSNLQKGNDNSHSDLQVVTCQATNMDGKTEIGTRFSSGYINVVLPLAMVSGPDDYTIKSMNDQIVLKCVTKSDASKPPKITWFRDGIKLNPIVDVLIYQEDNSLKIIASEFERVGDITGEYMCQATTQAPAQMVQVACNVTADAGGVVAPVTTAAISLWWIAIIIVILLILIIIILICCCIKRNRGESYPVDEVERKMGNDPEKDLQDSGFHDYQRPDKKPTQRERDPIGGSRASLDSSIKPIDSDDDNDSMAEYGDIDTGKFNEDGSFIGQYGTDRKKKEAPPPYSSV